MKVVVADHEKTARTMLSRLIERYLGMEVLEAENGLDALILIEEHHPDVAVIDLELPEFDGASVVRTVRDSATFNALPLVVTTRLAPRDIIQELAGHAVRDVYLKPYDLELVQRRLARVAAELRPRHGAPRDAFASIEAALGGKADSVLFVDGDANFRRFAVPIFSAGVTTVEATTGTSALRLAREQPFSTVCIGCQLGLLDHHGVATALRQLEGGDRLRLVRLNDDDDRGRNGLFDDWLPRVWVPGDFSRAFREVILGEYAFLHRLRQLPESIMAAELVSAVQQTAGVLMSSSAAPVSGGAVVAPPDVAVRVTLRSEDGTASVSLTLGATTPDAHAMMLLLTGGVEMEGISPEDALREISNTIGGRLQESLSQRGMQLRMGLPEPADPGDLSAGVTRLVSRAMSIGGGANLWLLLGADESVSAGVDVASIAELR